MNYEEITPEIVNSFTKPTEGYLCPQSANIYEIQFVYFKIRNVDSDHILFEVRKPQNQIGKPIPEQMRTVKYHFGPDFFYLSTIGTTLEFKVGNKAVNKFKMIEKHFFKDYLIKSYEFDVPFCPPNTVNSLEAVYDLPDIEQTMKAEMISSPWQSQSDSFYFVNNKLIMHNKALYSYAPFEQG